MIFGFFKSGIKDENGKDYIAVSAEEGCQLDPLATAIYHGVFDDEDSEYGEEDD